MSLNSNQLKQLVYSLTHLSKEYPNISYTRDEVSRSYILTFSNKHKTAAPARIFFADIHTILNEKKLPPSVRTLLTDATLSK